MKEVVETASLIARMKSVPLRGGFLGNAVVLGVDRREVVADSNFK